MPVKDVRLNIRGDEKIHIMLSSSGRAISFHYTLPCASGGKTMVDSV